MKVQKDLRISEHDDGAAILDVRAGEMYSTNGVGARILALLGENLSLDAITERISAEFEAPPERVRGDVEAFVADLQARKLLQS